MRYLGACLLCVLLTSMCAAGADTDDLAPQRAEFKLAWELAQKGDAQGLTPHLDHLKDYPLRAYLDYAYLDATLDSAPDAAVEQFLEANQDLPVDDALREDWLLALTRRQEWSKVLAYYRDETDPALRCAAVSAHLLKGDEPDRDTWTTAARHLWLMPAITLAGDVPNISNAMGDTASGTGVCKPLFDYLHEHRLINADMLRRRAELALEAHDYATARALLPQLSPGDRDWVQDWLDMSADPTVWLTQVQVPDEAPYQEMLLAGIKGVARNEPLRAQHLWTTLSQQYHFSSDDSRAMRTLLVLQHAWHLMPDARQQLKRLHDATDAQVPEWRTRLALRDQDWRGVLQALPGLGQDATTSEWRYWKARALEATGHRGEADALYLSLVRTPDYYGFLASDRLHEGYRIVQQVSRPAEEVIDQLSGRPGFIRARELMYAGLYAEADAEWNAATHGLSTPARCQSALLAERWGWHARVIPMLAGGGCWQDLALTYPLAFEQTLVPKSAQLKLDLSWIYGLIRAESVFRPNVISHAGAIGLMQLMPATGRDMATRLGLTLDDKDDLLDPPTNLILGSAYLRDMLHQFDGSEPLATAAYNAGAAKVSDWLPQTGSLPADVWIDSIPYTETRNYVHRVMGHTVMFDWRLNGKPERLSTRIGQVDAASDASQVLAGADLGTRP
ncbi:MAG TPA: transglycosylase SLT domain-containing protein [Gammaproteobacteria bacterium]|jgi:soluble lytic murein transglycosylase|nr:transglycosylase SLT domain-containing protein [Gammaproteobacteria bacterium]